MRNVKSPTGKVMEEYERIISVLGSEFDILRKMSVSEIYKNGFQDLSKVIQKMRSGEIHIEPGYDGVYGVIRVFANEQERSKLSNQMSFL